ncbi:Dyp-type peroxidase [Citrobacter sp. FP75]|uniref:Dyp-type peroxidase n=1 Tax=Citrobacter sp. FP75 TaxID=1852949 RepID=UPI001BC93573|nr:hypothetical protein [Citrobacter sp. FP75]
MDKRPLTDNSNDSESWALAYPHNKNVQGLVVSGFSKQPFARALFLEFKFSKNHKGNSWLKALTSIAPITDADGPDPRCAAIGFTWFGLCKMGLDPDSLESFDRPFKEGMFQEDRLRRLGDRRGNKWSKTVIDGGPKWSGNTPLDTAAHDSTARPFHSSTGKKTIDAITTNITVHAVLLLYEDNDAAVAQWAVQVTQILAPHGVAVVHQLPLNRTSSTNEIEREHFGFADGISQPIPFEKDVVNLSQTLTKSHDSVHLVPLGEILMGHPNGHGEIAKGPVVSGISSNVSGSDPGKLRPHPRGENFLDFGFNGSYMVVRELRQDVAQFWISMDECAKHLNKSLNAGSSPVNADWVASRVMGRDRNGHLLCPGGVLPANASGRPDNEFRFFDRDKMGYGCPLGSHVRRGNPRDGLAPSSTDKDILLNAANSHRILRRGRKYGPKISDPRCADADDRGLLFICLNTDIGRQFEFIQQTWILNPNFAVLHNETDPLLGPCGGFTIPDEQLRKIIDVKSYVQMVGGEYFFLPSIAALRYLEAL